MRFSAVFVIAVAACQAAFSLPTRADTYKVSGSAELNSVGARDEVSAWSADFQLAKATLAMEGGLSQRLTSHLSFLYETGCTPLQADEVSLSYALGADRRTTVDLGQLYLGIAPFTTQLVADPLTLDLGEERERALRLRISRNDWRASVYGYASRTPSRTNPWALGADLGFVRHGPGYGLEAGVAAIQNLGGARRLQQWIAVPRLQADVPAWSLHADMYRGPWHLLTSYLATLRPFDAGELAYKGAAAQPWALQLELARNLSTVKGKWVAAFSYQQTAEALALDFPKERLSAGVSTQLEPSVQMAIEWMLDRDYGLAVGGIGGEVRVVTLKLAAEF